jgi:hypothetical protein
VLAGIWRLVVHIKAVAKDNFSEKGIKLPGNEVYYTNSLILQVETMLRNKLHCQKVLISFPYHIRFHSGAARPALRQVTSKCPAQA